MNNRFKRTELLLGSEALSCISSAKIAVAGLGGVGSYVAEALVRTGVGYLRIIDFDVIKYSNFNRQLFAVESSVSEKKVDAAEGRLKQINPECIIDKRYAFIDESNCGDLIDGIDLVVDAIDSVASKVALLEKAVIMGIPVVSSMGAAAKVNPLHVRSGDISESKVCPLAKAIRKRLHQKNIFSGIRCVYSIESVDVSQVSEIDSEESCEEGLKRPSLGSISYLPGIFGLIAAHEAIKLIIENKKISEQSLSTEMTMDS